MRHLFFAVIAGVFLSASTVHALGFAPVKYEFTADPGQVVVDSVKVMNTTDTEQVFKINVLNFTVSADEGGSPILYETGDALDDGRGLARWIRVLPTPFTLAARAQQYIPFEIHVPKNAIPGGYFGAVLIEPIDPTQAIGGYEGEVGARVAVQNQAGPLILLHVRGDELSENLQVAKFFRDKRLYTSLPVTFFTRIENQSGTYLKPLGHISVRSMFGKEVSSLAFNDDGGNVLPQSTRKFSTVWQRNELSDDTFELWKEIRNFGLGRYKATLFLEYKSGESIGQVKSTQVFWVLPWQLLLIFLAILIVLRWILKHYNRAIIRSAQRRMSRS